MLAHSYPSTSTVCVLLAQTLHFTKVWLAVELINVF